MINFVICEDNKIILQKNIEIINKAMFNNNINYRIYSFSEYNEELENIIKDNSSKKIYILDIEIDEVSGLDISRKIRDNDLESFIIISTAHTEYLPYTIKSKLLIFAFVSKFDDYETSLTNEIKNILDSYPEAKILKVKIKGKEYNINYNDILQIYYDNQKRKTIIKTKSQIYEANIPIISIITNLDNRFIKLSNNKIINKMYYKLPNSKNDNFNYIKGDEIYELD